MMQFNAKRASPQCTIVFTDLDGSLLDHTDYSHAAAAPALERLREQGIPLVPASSKTAAEIIAFNEQIDNNHPFIFENGGGIGVPRGYFPYFTAGRREGDYRLHTNGRPYTEIVNCLRSLRDRHGWRFSGFADWGTDQVMAHTGLTRVAAKAARQRLLSEPVLWQDGSATLLEFTRQLQEQNLHLERGGRFLSVQSIVDKGKAMNQLLQHYTEQYGRPIVTVACGDSPNDRSMLLQADFAVIIPDHLGRHLQIARNDRVHYASAPGPAGWREGIEHFLS
jgi:mannosyl-3-phosphoglycerate phosphatase family protein